MTLTRIRRSDLIYICLEIPAIYYSNLDIFPSTRIDTLLCITLYKICYYSSVGLKSLLNN